jgi:hypothetical protein
MAGYVSRYVDGEKRELCNTSPLSGYKSCDLARGRNWKAIRALRICPSP